MSGHSEGGTRTAGADGGGAGGRGVGAGTGGGRQEVSSAMAAAGRAILIKSRPALASILIGTSSGAQYTKSRRGLIFSMGSDKITRYIGTHEA